MKILVVGSGGREHAITWRLAQDECKHELFCAPGNAGTSAIATNIAVGAEDIEGIVDCDIRLSASVMSRKKRQSLMFHIFYLYNCFLIIFPLVVLGKLSRNSTILGYL